MKNKYGLVLAVFLALECFHRIVMLFSNKLFFSEGILIITSIILIYKSIKNEHDNFFTIILAIKSLFNVGFFAYVSITALSNQTYFLGSDKIFSIMLWIMNVINSLPLLLLLYMSYSKNKGEEIYRPYIPSISKFVIMVIFIILNVYLMNNSGGTYVYELLHGAISLIIFTIEYFCMAKFIQES